MDKKSISAHELLIDSFRLGDIIYQSGLRPELIIGVWRGGAPVAIAVHEYFSYMGHEADHFPIRALSYTGINERSENVDVTGLEYLEENKVKYRQILVIDDVFDTGNSFKSILDLISNLNPQFDLKIAAPWYKPESNMTNIIPDYFIHETDQWLVFPHELHGLSLLEIEKYKPEFYELFIKKS